MFIQIFRYPNEQWVVAIHNQTTAGALVEISRPWQIFLGLESLKESA